MLYQITQPLLSTAKRNLFYHLAWKENILCEKLASNYKISDNYKRIYFYHIRKCGGTSTNNSFLSLGKDDQGSYPNLYHSLNYRAICNKNIFVGYNKKLIEEGNYFYAFSHIPCHKLKLPERTFTITGFRDPLERVISIYKMLLKKSDRKIDSRLQKKWLGKNFCEFINNIPRREMLAQIYHFSGSFSIDEALDNISDCSFVYDMDTYAEDIDQLSRKLHLPLTPSHERKLELELTIDPSMIEECKDKLRPEYQLIEEIKKYRQTQI